MKRRIALLILSLWLTQIFLAPLAMAEIGPYPPKRLNDVNDCLRCTDTQGEATGRRVRARFSGSHGDSCSSTFPLHAWFYAHRQNGRPRWAATL